MTQNLAWEAHYGKLPFDRFVIEKGDCTLSSKDMQKEWTNLTKQWLALDSTQRQIYYEKAFELGSLMPEDPRLITHELIEYALKPFQTCQERNLMSPEAVWLRTCYDPNLEDAYQEMSSGSSDIVGEPQVLDNSTLYDFDTSWHRLLERIPNLCDSAWTTNIPDVSDPAPAEDHPSFPLWDADRRQVVRIYLLDRQAILEGLITILWLDRHGECVWWYRVSPEFFLEFTGWMASSGLEEMSSWHRVGESDEERQRLEKGAVIDWFL